MPLALVGPAVSGSVVPADMNLLQAALGLVAVGLLSGFTAGAVAVGFRWYSRERVPGGVSLLFGLVAVALYLNVNAALGAIVQGQLDLLAAEAIVFNLAALGTAAAFAPVGRRVGDRMATDLFAFTRNSAVELDADVSQLVQAVGRIISVTLPEEIDDIEGYEPPNGETREQLAGKTLLFPRGLTVTELRERLAARLKDDYDVGYVDVELDADGTVAYLAVGARMAGVGPTLPPGSVAVATHADPPRGASPGDAVEVWRGGDDPARVAAAELRAVVDDAVTLAVDSHDAATLAGGEFRLVTLPATPRAEREFASLLRAADETMGAVVVEAGSRLAGQPVGALDVTVAAIRPSDGEVEAIPSRTRALSVGDTLYVVARPTDLRRLETGASGTDEGGVDTS